MLTNYYPKRDRNQWIHEQCNTVVKDFIFERYPVLKASFPFITNHSHVITQTPSHYGVHYSIQKEPKIRAVLLNATQPVCACLSKFWNNQPILTKFTKSQAKRNSQYGWARIFHSVRNFNVTAGLTQSVYWPRYKMTNRGRGGGVVSRLFTGARDLPLVQKFTPTPIPTKHHTSWVSGTSPCGKEDSGAWSWPLTYI